MQLRFKSCPRCKGDVILDRDQYGWYQQCLQCGHLRDVVDLVEIHQQKNEVGKKEGKGKKGVSWAA